MCVSVWRARHFPVVWLVHWPWRCQLICIRHFQSETCMLHEQGLSCPPWCSWRRLCCSFQYYFLNSWGETSNVCVSVIFCISNKMAGNLCDRKCWRDIFWKGVWISVRRGGRGWGWGGVWGLAVYFSLSLLVCVLLSNQHLLLRRRCYQPCTSWLCKAPLAFPARELLVYLRSGCTTLHCLGLSSVSERARVPNLSEAIHENTSTHVRNADVIKITRISLILSSSSLMCFIFIFGWNDSV